LAFTRDERTGRCKKSSFHSGIPRFMRPTVQSVKPGKVESIGLSARFNWSARWQVSSDPS